MRQRLLFGNYRQLPSAYSLGFTLAELLISLLIIGELATFTIPKVITSQQNNTYNAKAKEAAAMIAGAYQLYSFSNTITSGTSAGDFTQYMNYVAADSSTTIDLAQQSTTRACGGGMAA